MRVLAALAVAVGCYGPTLPVGPDGGTPPGDAASAACVDRVITGAADLFACALRTDGTLWCWGQGAGGRLGNNSTNDSPVPVPVAGLVGPRAVALGGAFGCVIDEEVVKCWGDDSRGQLGRYPTTQDAHTPVAVVVPNVKTPGGLGTGDRVACTFVGASVWCWGANGANEAGGAAAFAVAPTRQDLPAVITGMAGGDLHTCAVLATGDALCWGDNDDLQVGHPDALRMNSDVNPISLSGVTTLSSGVGHTCGLATGDLNVACWGRNDEGQLGNSARGVDAAVPISVVVGEPVLEISLGAYHTCVLTEAGGVFCWGKNADHQLGDGTTNTREAPVRAIVADALSTVRHVTAGSNFTCVVTEDAEAWCWGGNADGQLGNGTPSAAAQRDPVRVAMPCP
jgi:alpha-tubulin suppressor-like RCC1 family protein